MQLAQTDWMQCARSAPVALALVAGAACGGGERCELGAMADTTGWQVVDAGPFVFKLPPGYRDQYPLGTDSYVGWWTHGERSIRFSWGPHNGDPRQPPNDYGGPLCETRIGGRTALVRTTREAGDSLYHVGGWWEKPDSMGANLYVAATAPADDSEGRRIAATVIRTVRVRTAWSDEDRARFTYRLCEISRVIDARAGMQRSPADEPRNCPAVRPPPPVYDSVR